MIGIGGSRVAVPANDVDRHVGERLSDLVGEVNELAGISD